MPRQEKDFQPFLTRDLNGGSLYGEGYDIDTAVCLTKYGEVSFALGENGMMVSDFTDLGLTFYYSDLGDLETTALDVGDYILNLTANEVVNMPHQGKDLLEAVRYLAEQELEAVVFIHHYKDSMDIELFNRAGDSVKTINYRDITFDTGLKGEIKLGKGSVIFELLGLGDDFSVSLGEADKERAKLAGIQFAKTIDFDEEIFGSDTRRLQKLAEKIILN